MAFSSNNTSTSSSSFPKYPYPTEFNVLDFVPKDLSFRNYKKWRKLMLDFIESRGLIGFIDGTVEELPRKVDSVESSSYDAAGANTDDEHYMSWKRSNNLLRGWILATLTEDTRLQVLPFKTAKDVWTKLEQIFDSGIYEEPFPAIEKYSYPTEFNVLDFVPKELSERNYDKWKELMLDFIESRGLIGFIDGTVKEPPKWVKIEEASSIGASGGARGVTEYYMLWKRFDNLVRGWILTTLPEDIRLQVLSLKTANQMWTELEELFNPAANLFRFGEEIEKTIFRYLPLYKATINGDWDSAHQIIEIEPYAVRALITPHGATALMLAVMNTSSVQRNRFAKKLLEKMSKEDIAVVDENDRTALHFAAGFGNIDGVKMLVNKNSDLPNVLDDERATALNYAALSRKREIVLYLWETTKDDIKLMDDVCAELLRDLTKSEFYDKAVTLLERKPKLAASMEPSLFELIAEKRSSFPSGTSLNFWQSIFYWGVPTKSGSIARSHSGGGDPENPTNSSNTSVRQRLHSMFWEVAEKLVPEIKRVQETKMTHHHALELLKSLCKEIVNEASLSQVEKIFRPALYKAVYVGIPEVVEEIIVSYPLTLCFPKLNGLNIFQHAITWRRERVFNLIYQLDGAVDFISTHDNLGNSGLHLAGRLGHQQQINLRASGVCPILQMQRELQWFKEVEKLSLPKDKEQRNNDGMTPAEVFTETHQKLMREGERWMKDTATSCTIVAALIATMVFAAAITVPGGNSNDSGQPLLSKQNAFAIFGVSDALALFSSITSVLMFLLILTSRYSEEDFFDILPKRLVIGLVTLFVSILSTMVAFGAILYLVFGNNKAWILIPVVALAGIPVTLFGALQFPLLVEMIQSTYGQGIFGKQSDRALE